MTGETSRFATESNVAGKDLVAQIQELLGQGNARHRSIHDEEGHGLLSVPLTANVVTGGLVPLSAPVLAGLAARAATISPARLSSPTNLERSPEHSVAPPHLKTGSNDTPTPPHSRGEG